MLDLPVRLDLTDLGRLAFAPQPGRHPPQWLRRACPDTLVALAHRLDVALGWSPGRLVQFMAARPGEGTSSIAVGYAAMAAEALRREVLLIEPRPSFHSPGLGGEPFEAVPSLAEAFLAGRPLTDALRIGAGTLYVATLAGQGNEQSYSALSRPGFWSELKGVFDEVVLDCPSAQSGPTGLLASSHADAVVVVVEAERTPEPVVRRLLDDLEMARANVVGTVLNKRRLRLPRFLMGGR